MAQLPGSLLFTMILLSLAHGFVPEFSRIYAGVAAWLAGLLLANRLVGAQRLQVIVMLLVGGAGVLWGLAAGGSLPLEGLLASNQALLAMLAAVTFLRLVSLPPTDYEERLPMGPHALWRTLLGVHLFGAVINLSSIVILGDRLSARRPMSALQALVLSRGFALAAHWSPFFAAMGIALTNAPGSELSRLSLIGLPIALLALAISSWQLARRPEAAEFRGYPLQFGSLWIPGLLALLLILAHALVPQVSILTLVATLSLGLTLVLLILREKMTGLKLFGAQVTQGLPRMAGELLLFLAAGVLATGIASAVQASGFVLPMEHAGTFELWLALWVMVGLSAMGVHPVISIATLGGLLAPLQPDPNLLGITFLMTWAAGVSLSPFSGMHLAMRGRYRVDNLAFFRGNLGFTLLMLLIDGLVLGLYERLAG